MAVRIWVRSHMRDALHIVELSLPGSYSHSRLVFFQSEAAHRLVEVEVERHSFASSKLVFLEIREVDYNLFVSFSVTSVEHTRSLFVVQLECFPFPGLSLCPKLALFPCPVGSSSLFPAPFPFLASPSQHIRMGYACLHMEDFCRMWSLLVVLVEEQCQPSDQIYSHWFDHLTFVVEVEG